MRPPYSFKANYSSKNPDMKPVTFKYIVPHRTVILVRPIWWERNWDDILTPLLKL